MIKDNSDKKRLSWLASDNTITVNLDGKTHMLARTDAHSEKLIAALKAKDFEVIPILISAAARIEKFSDGKFSVRDGKILVDGVEAPPTLGKKIKEFADAGLPYQPLVKFCQKLFQNPSKRSVDCLFDFLEANSIPIDNDGNIILYKKIRSDFKDVHSGTYDNSPGNVVKMPRNQVDEDPNKTCSAGLHLCGASYLRYFGGEVVVECSLNPANCVAVPKDYGNSKMRVSEYRVIRVVDDPKEVRELLYKYEDEKTENNDSDIDAIDEDLCPECGIEQSYCDCELNDDYCDNCEDEGCDSCF